MKEQFEELKTTLNDFIKCADGKYATKEELKNIKENVNWYNNTRLERAKSRGAIIVAFISAVWFIVTNLLNK